MATRFRSLVSALAPYKWRYVIGILALLVTDLFQQVLPVLTGDFVDDLKYGRLDSPGIWRYIGLIMGAALLVALGRYGWRIYVFGTSRMVEQDVRAALFRKLEELSPSFYHRNKTGDLMAMATNDLQAVRAIAGEGILMAADTLLLTVITLNVMIATIGWQVSLISLAPLPILAIFSLWFGKMMFTHSREVQDAFGRLSDVTQENITGIRVVKAFGQEASEERRFDEANRNYLDKFRAMVRVQSLIEPTIHVLVGACLVLALLVPGRAVLRGELELGDFISLTMFINMLVWPMIAMGWVINIIQRGLAAFSRIQGVLFEPPDVTNTPDAIVPEGGIRGKVEIRNLTFRYGENLPPALENIAVTIRPGQTLGIIGRTGSGKSTLVSLLARLFNPPRGTVFIDGVDVLDLDLKTLREQIAFVPQESFLFSRTVRENIAFAPGKWTEEQIREATRTAQVEQDILEFLPQGYDTVVGERGVTLSGGQRQRVGLSRAVLKNAPILVLDDCLSAVDTSTEARILAGLRPVMADRTTIIISHRVNAVKHADHIIVLEGGKIVERGTHEQLLELGGWYARTHQRQQLEEAIASTE